MRTNHQNSIVRFPERREAASDQDNGSNEASNERHVVTTSQAPPLIKRWPPAMKAKVLEEVREGTLSLDEACKRYALSIEEYLTWQQGIDLFGLAGLQVNKQQELRRIRNRSRKSSPEGSHWSAAASPASDR
jgi:hypothetical protein